MSPNVIVAALVAGALSVPSGAAAQRQHQNAVIDLWMANKPAFGVFVPNEAPRGAGAPAQPSGPRPTPVYSQAGGEKLAANPLYDYVFLNLEGSYDADAVKAIGEGLRSPRATSRKALIVRVPAFHEDAAAGRSRIREVFAAGADGITFPHVQSVGEARQILAAVSAEKIDVWSSATPNGEKLVMMMIEDPGALAQATEFANLEGYSILACGIGSLTQALGGNREAAEAGTQKILAETKRVKLVNMLTATTQDVEKRVKEGFLGILAQGQEADKAIAIGRAASGR
jgi:2-keto-3-deoxy-L-rhamnonate aldolase RhmA